MMPCKRFGCIFFQKSKSNLCCLIFFAVILSKCCTLFSFGFEQLIDTKRHQNTFFFNSATILVHRSVCPNVPQGCPNVPQAGAHWDKRQLMGKLLYCPRLLEYRLEALTKVEDNKKRRTLSLIWTFQLKRFLRQSKKKKSVPVCPTFPYSVPAR